MKLLLAGFILLLFVFEALGLGEIVATCPFHTRAPDDALLFPNQPGKSHMHDFYGAKEISASATPFDMRNSETSCNPTFDHSAYWTRNEKKLFSKTIIFKFSFFKKKLPSFRMEDM